MKPLIFIKIGGSLISPKHGRRRIERKKLRRILGEIMETMKLLPQFSFVICHGHGQIGHERLIEHDRKSKSLSCQRVMELSRIMKAAIKVNQIVLNELQLLDLPAVPLHLHQSFIDGNNEKVDGLDFFFQAINDGLYPVPNGVMILDNQSDWKVWSTERVIDYLVKNARKRGYKVDSIVQITNIDGVQNIFGLREDKITLEELSAIEIRKTKGDATGGMGEKIKYVSSWVKFGIKTSIISGNIVGEVKNVLLDHNHGGTVFVR